MKTELKQYSVKSIVEGFGYNELEGKGLFGLIKDNQLWVGATNFNTGMYFRVPDSFVYDSSYKFERERNGVKVNRVPGVCWHTSLDHSRRHEPLKLMSADDNFRFSKHTVIKGVGYKKYDNYDAIEVPLTDAIPSDYSDVMGVPISFLSKYNPEQFETLGMAASAGYDPDIVGIPFKGGKDGRPLVNGRNTYARVLLRTRKS